MQTNIMQINVYFYLDSDDGGAKTTKRGAILKNAADRLAPPLEPPHYFCPRS